MAIFLDRAFCDESYGPSIKTTGWYVVAGFLGTRQQWRKFERAWRPFVADGFDFHASSLVRSGKHADKQRGLVRAIETSRIKGVVATMDVRAFRRHKTAIRQTMVRTDQGAIDEYVLTFAQYLHLTAKRLDKSNRRIAFVYDRRPDTRPGFLEEHRKWYEDARDNPSIDFRHRLGPIFPDDRHHAIALHAADFLANCGYRHMCGDRTWQWDALNLATTIIPFSYDEAFWTKWLKRPGKL